MEKVCKRAKPLTLTGASNSKHPICYRTAFYPYFYVITTYVQRKFLTQVLHLYRPLVEPLGKIIFCNISVTGSPATRCR